MTLDQLLKRVLVCFLLVTSSSAFSQSYLKNEIENEKQTDFPGVQIDGKVESDLYAINLDGEESGYNFEKKATLPSGTTLKINSYVLAKEILDYLDIKTVTSKTNKEELKKVLSSNDKKLVTDFFYKLSEKLRPVNSEKELALIKKEIAKRKTQDAPDETLFFKTGFIEVSPLEKTDVRYFVPLDKIKNLQIIPEEGKVKLLQSLTLLSFKKIKANLNAGYFSEDELKDFEKLEGELTSACNSNCVLKGAPADLLENLLRPTQYDYLKELDAVAINTKTLIGEACLIYSYQQSCAGNSSTKTLDVLMKRPEVKKFFDQYQGNLEQGCRAFPK